MKIEVPLYFNWYNRGILAPFPDIEWRRVPPGYYHNIQLQGGHPNAESFIMMFWLGLPAKVYNVDGPSPPLPIFHIMLDQPFAHIHHYAIGDWVEDDAWIGFTLRNDQQEDAEFRVWAELEKSLETINLDQGLTRRSILDR